MDLSQLGTAYQKFVRAVREKSFFEGNIDEACARVSGVRLIRPPSRKYQESGEICFVYKPPQEKIEGGNDYKVIVCSTKRQRGWVGKDYGWVIIVAGPQGNERKVYSSYPLVRRSEAFFDHLLREARVARWRVLHRPRVCAKGCEAPMLLVSRRGHLKSRYWQCALHPEDKTHNRRLDDLEKPLPENVVEEREATRAGRRKRREKVRKAGGDPFKAFKERMAHPWGRERAPLNEEF